MKTFLKNFLIFTFFTFLFITISNYSFSATDTLDAVLDNTLYEDEFGSLSNGSGQYCFSGTTLTGRIRRCLMSFRVGDQIPPGAVITDVKLVLNMSRTISGSSRVNLHKVTKNWGEGGSFAPGEEGSGAQSEAGDATWIHNFYDSDFWDNSGGDFLAKESGSVNVEGIGLYTWNDTQMVNDVQDWINDAWSDYGWILICDESQIATAKRFDTKDNQDPNVRPKLIVTYTFNDLALKLGVFTEGLYHGSFFYADTFKVNIRNSFSPYSIVDSSEVYYIFNNWFVFNNAPSGSYYIEVDQRNSLNTWSNMPLSFSTGGPFTVFDFTTSASQAFGDNQVLEDQVYCIYSGDVNKDNVINLLDVLIVYNSATAFQTGYVVPDVDGNEIVDLDDLLIVYNNSVGFVTEKRP
jgi:hypothetical protein